MSNFMFLLDAQKVGFADGFLRKILAWICRQLYELVSGLLQTIFYLANFDILDLADEMMNRVYVIIGIFMLFKITISLLNYLVNPDKISDKEAGASKLISRVIISLCMLILLPGAFSIMTDLQNQLLPVLPRIIIGKDTANSGTKSTDLAEATADNMVITIVRGFTYPAVTDQGACTNAPALKDLDDFQNNIADKCDLDDNYYAYSNHGIISFIVAALMVYVTFSLAIATAIRAFKLIILRVIAPAPVLSYIDPKSSKVDGMFNKWIKMFISTWAELLVNLGIIYFIIFMIQKLFTNNNWMTYLSDAPGEGFIHGLVIAFIIIGLLMFAREAPKFIMDALGIKNAGGFGRMLGMGGAALGSARNIGKEWQASRVEGRNVFSSGLRGLGHGVASLSNSGSAILNDKNAALGTGWSTAKKYQNASMDRRIAVQKAQSSSGESLYSYGVAEGKKLFSDESNVYSYRDSTGQRKTVALTRNEFEAEKQRSAMAGEEFALYARNANGTYALDQNGNRIVVGHLTTAQVESISGSIDDHMYDRYSQAYNSNETDSLGNQLITKEKREVWEAKVNTHHATTGSSKRHIRNTDGGTVKGEYKGAKTTAENLDADKYSVRNK